MIEYKNVSLADKVYETLEFNILSGKYPIGDIISEKKLSEELGVSRTPIREAMTRLFHENLIKETKSGTVVVGVTVKDVKDLFEVKRRIETIVIRRAIENITESELSRLKDNLDQQEFYAQKNEPVKVRDLDTEFHDIIYKACGSTVFDSILSPIHHKMMKYRRVSLEKAHRIIDSVGEHKAIYEAIKDKDVEKAESLMLIHIDHAYANIMEVSQYGIDDSSKDN